MTTSTPFRDLLHAANLRHGIDGFTSPPKEGVLRIFSDDDVQWHNQESLTQRNQSHPLTLQPLSRNISHFRTKMMASYKETDM